MKRTWLIMLTALLLAACAAPPTNREATSSTNINKASDTKVAAPLSEADAVAREKEIWGMLEKKDYSAFGEALAADFIYVGADGVHDKVSTVKNMTGFVPSEMTFADWKYIPIDKDAAVLVYSVKAKAAMEGQAASPLSVYASSVVVNRDGKWLFVYHQDCDMATTPPPPPPKTVASPATTPATPATSAETTSDVVANEKAVWAALAAKQWDVFGNYLASDALEAERYGVVDRAGSIKGVQSFDFSKSTLSDFKTVKIDEDASIVTYLAHFPGQKPDTEYHSTVWANRNGKWNAVFHHGTPMMAPSPAPAKSAQK